MSIVTCAIQGRFGSATAQYLHARAYAAKHGHEFVCAPWIGDRVFDLHDTQLTPEVEARLERVDEYTAQGRGDVIVWCYGSSQACMIYTKKQAQEWLNIKPELLQILERIVPRYSEQHGWDLIVGHQRKGDYIGYGYPVVNLASYHRAAEQAAKELHLGPPRLVMVTEENPLPNYGTLHDHLAFLPDFYRLLRAPVLLRGNSSFSWLAGLLGNGVVYSPVIDNATGGAENDCPFVAGNHPRICMAPNVTNLYIQP